MGRDDALDKELSQLEKEIEAKVDSLFVEMEEGALSGEEDPWRHLKELFLTLEWEIDEATLGKISLEARALQEKFPEGGLGTLLGWISEVARKIQGQLGDAEQGAIQLLLDLKEALFSLVEDPFQDPGPILTPLRARMERFLVGAEEEAPTVTLEKALEEGIATEEIEIALEEDLTEEPIPSVELKSEQPVVEGKAITLEIQEPPGPEERVLNIKHAFQECGRKLDEVVSYFQGGDPLGLNQLLSGLQGRIQEFARTLEERVSFLREQIQTLESLDLVPRPPEPQTEPKVEVCKEEVLFFAVSNKVFAIPMGSVLGVFRVPYQLVPQIAKASEVTLRDRQFPLVSIWEKLGVGRAIFTFPGEEKRILLVHSDNGEVGVLVDRILARKEVAVNPVEDAPSPLVIGAVTIEKSAYLVDLKSI